MERKTSLTHSDLRSVTAHSAPLRLEASERYERFKLEAITEVILRAVGILAIVAPLFLLLILPSNSGTGHIMSNGLLAAVFAATGLFVYAYGTRGFRRQFRLDTAKKTLTLTKVNINNQSRMSRRIDLDDIESLYLRRQNGDSEFAELHIRLADRTTTIVALSGRTSDVKYLHHEMCDMINISRPDITHAPQPKARKPEKPRLFASAHG